MEHETHRGVLEDLFERTTDYVETRLDLIKLKAIKKSSEVASGLISKVILGVMLCFFVMMLNIALGLWIGSMLGKTYLGFFIMAGIYLIAGLIIFACRDKWLKAPVADSIISKIHK